MFIFPIIFQLFCTLFYPKIVSLDDYRSFYSYIDFVERLIHYFIMRYKKSITTKGENIQYDVKKVVSCFATQKQTLRLTCKKKGILVLKTDFQHIIQQQKMTNIFTQTIQKLKEGIKLSDLVNAIGEQVKTRASLRSLFRPQKIHQRYNLMLRRSSHEAKGSQTQWLESEKKLFLWLILGFCKLHYRTPSQINEKEWVLISESFPHKSSLLLKYEALSLERSKQRVHWSCEQEALLSKLQKQISGKWTLIAKQLFFGTGGSCFKTSKQCREHWFNHLDPQIIRGGWSVAEDILILDHVSTKGRHWASLIPLLPQRRTEHMLKNRFAALISLGKKLSAIKEESRLAQTVKQHLVDNLLKDSQSSGRALLQNSALSFQKFKQQNKLLKIQQEMEDNKYEDIYKSINKQEEIKRQDMKTQQNNDDKMDVSLQIESNSELFNQEMPAFTIPVVQYYYFFQPYMGYSN